MLEAVHAMIAELRHEIGNPLNSIKAAITLLRRGITTYPLEKTLTYLDATLSEVARLERLLLSLRRLSEPAVSPEPFAAGPFLEAFLAQYGYEVERRGIIFTPPAPADAQLAVDREALSQVLLDLLNSEVQRLVRVEEPQLELHTERHALSFTIEMRSNGRAAEEGKELPFVTSMLGPRGDDYRLSLAISRQILLQMGATVATTAPAPDAWISRIELPLAGPAAA